jgi:hypothetical protein
MIALTLAAALMLNTDVTQATLSQTVCHPGYSAAYRRSHPVHLRARKGY